MRLLSIVSRLHPLRHIFTVALCLCLSAPATAQQARTKPFDAENVVIAFYKTGGAKPNFTKWVTDREPYLTTAVAIRPEIMERELARLNKEYNDFDPARDLIVIQTSAIAKVFQESDPLDTEKKTTFLDLSFRVGDADYFPYDFMDERFAVIPKDLATHMKPQLQNEQFAYMKDILKEGRSVTMVIELRPVRAVMDEPFDMDGTGGGVNKKDGKGQWMFLTDIATLSIWTKAGSMLWEYTAPWYITPMRDSLLNLHTEKRTAE